MRICVIGKVRPGLSYKKWAKNLRNKVDSGTIKQLNITSGNGTLNQFVRRFAKEINVPVVEFAPNTEIYGDNAKLYRNRVIVANSDRVVGFIPE